MFQPSKTFEIGPIRPPSEAMSLLIRVNRNCPWNRCAFCPVYKGQKFSIRTREEILADIEQAASIADEIRALSWRCGLAGAVTPDLFHQIAASRGSSESAQHVAHWMLRGAESVFLQDANALIARVDDLVEILETIRSTFPSVRRVTTYSRSHTASKRSVEDLARLKAAGLDRVHIGLETGSNAVLEFVQKGVTAERHIDAGRRIKAAGLELSEYIMPGLGGRRWTNEHAIETARVLNAIDPDFIRIRSLAIPPGTPLAEKKEAGEFELLSGAETIEELRLLIENLEGITSRIVSDHILNLLEEVQGKLPEDKQAIISSIDRFLALSDEEKDLFQLGRRLGVFRTPTDLDRSPQSSRLKALLGEIRERYGGLEAGLQEIVKQFI